MLTKNELDKIIVVGDRILVRPEAEPRRTSSGLYLPPGVDRTESAQSGFALKIGPGVPIPAPADDEPWKDADESGRYIPLQAREGDLVVFLRKHAIEVEYLDEKLLIISQDHLLFIIRDEDLGLT
jgi:co-chaperonin GroES (HSP10)